MVNVFTGVGRLTRDVDYKEINGTTVAKFTIAINDYVKGEETANYIPVTAFGKIADNCYKYLSKGRQVAVVGKVQTGSYENKDGKKVYTTDIIANNVDFIGGRNTAETPTETTSEPTAPAEPVQETIGSGFHTLDADIPF